MGIEYTKYLEYVQIYSNTKYNRIRCIAASSHALQCYVTFRAIASIAGSPAPAAWTDAAEDSPCAAAERRERLETARRHFGFGCDLFGFWLMHYYDLLCDIDVIIIY